MQKVLDILGLLHPVRLGYIWDFVIPIVLGLVVGALIGYQCRNNASWRVSLVPGIISAVGAFLLEFLYRAFIFSNDEPAVYQGSGLWYAELILTFFVFLFAGIAFEMALSSALGGLIKKLWGQD